MVVRIGYVANNTVHRVENRTSGILIKNRCPLISRRVLSAEKPSPVLIQSYIVFSSTVDVSAVEPLPISVEYRNAFDNKLNRKPFHRLCLSARAPEPSDLITKIPYSPAGELTR